jgi:hypothetical protein
MEPNKEWNEFLVARGGLVNSNILDDSRPLYKLVWSTSEIELRHGTFREFHDDVFIREVTETRWTKKYWYINDRWILERWIPPGLVATKELPNSVNGSYEPIYTFEDGDRLYLTPNIKVLDFIITMAEKPHHITKEELMQELIDKEEKEVQHIMEAMDYRSDIGVALHLNAGVGYGQKGKDHREKLS